jgi:predicted transcriptional regulator
MTRVWKWNRPVTVREVLEDLQRERSIAYTTVMTVLDNLHQKGWVRREAEGRAYRYEAVSTRAAYAAALMNEAWSRSDNPAAALVAFFGMMSSEQREALQDAMRIVQGPTPTAENPAPGENPETAPKPANSGESGTPEHPQGAAQAPGPKNPPAAENPPIGENPPNREPSEIAAAPEKPPPSRNNARQNPGSGSREDGR